MPGIKQTLFQPARRLGIVFHIVAAVVLGGAAALVFLQAYAAGQGAGFVFGLLATLLLGLPFPLLLYRFYALLQAYYVLDRDGLQIRWGLRAEDIPLPQIEWIRPANELGFGLPLPWLQWPGALLGTRKVEGLGEVEFMASDLRRLLLVATGGKVYAISPQDDRAFMRTFRQITELGSLTPIPSYSVLPVAFARTVWGDLRARSLLLVGLALTVMVFVAAGLTIPARTAISLGYDAFSRPMEPISPERLLLLPLVCVALYVVGLVFGLFLYRRADQRQAAYLVFTGNILTPVLLLLAILFM